MLYPDIFECYDNSVEIKSDCLNINFGISIPNKELFDSYLIYYIENKYSQRYDKMKKYIQFGFDINEKVKKIEMTWIEFACIHNDIPLIGILRKSNVNIHTIDTNNLNLISKCVINKNFVLLKYFLNLGVNPNLKNKENGTPLLLSCIMKNGFECAKILLEYPLIDISSTEISIMDIILDKINNGQKEYIELLKLLLVKKNKLNFEEMTLVRNYTISNKLDIVKVFVDRFPNIINKSSDDESKETIVNYALHEEYNEMLKYFFNIKELDYRKTNIEDINYLEYLCGFQMFDMLDLFCKKFPKSLKITYTNSMNIIENVILTYDFEWLDSNQIYAVKKIIKILVSNGANINHINDSGYAPLFPSIQYGTSDFVKFIIEQGANIKLPLIKNTEFPPLTNNDPISFAIQLNKFDVLEVLINSGALLHQIEINGFKYYTSILICLKYKRQIHFNYLLKNIKEISLWIKSNNIITNFLFDYAIKNSCLDELILKEIVPEFKINSFDFSDPNFGISHNEKKISICIDEYKNITNKLFILNGILETNKIILKLFSLTNKNYSSLIENFSNLYFSITDTLIYDDEIKKIHNNFYDWIDSFINIICDRVDYYNMFNLKKIFEYIFKLYYQIPDDEISDLDNFIENKFMPKNYIKKINNVFKLFGDKKKLLEEYEKELLLIIDKHKNNMSNEITVSIGKKILNQNIVIKKLFKLFWPEKQPHYEYMYDSIVNNHDKIIICDNKYNNNNIYSVNNFIKSFNIDKNKSNIIVISKNKIKSTIFYNPDINISPRWIKTYAPNIGKEEKNDPNHMFSFALDNLLEKIPCIYVETKDTNHDGLNLMCYFSGMLEFNGEIQTGCYEYFINTNGTLFHRMFRTWTSLPPSVKKLLKN